MLLKSYTQQTTAVVTMVAKHYPQNIFFFFFGETKTTFQLRHLFLYTSVLLLFYCFDNDWISPPLIVGIEMLKFFFFSLEEVLHSH